MHGSGNVFRDLGRNNADAEQFKAILANEIIQVLDREHLMVRAAHVRTGVAAADFSCIRHADLGRFTADRLTTGPIALTLITLPRTSPTASHTQCGSIGHTFRDGSYKSCLFSAATRTRTFPMGPCASRANPFLTSSNGTMLSTCGRRPMVSSRSTISFHAI